MRVFVYCRLPMFGTLSMENDWAPIMDTRVPSGVWMLTVSFLRDLHLLDETVYSHKTVLFVKTPTLFIHALLKSFS